MDALTHQAMTQSTTQPISTSSRQETNRSNQVSQSARQPVNPSTRQEADKSIPLIVTKPKFRKATFQLSNAVLERLDRSHLQLQLDLGKGNAPYKEVIVEEFIHGTEFTFDTITINGKIRFFNVELYRPDMLTARSREDIAPQTISLRNLDQPHFKRAFDMGQRVITALGYHTGFTHMEWFLKPDGDVVFGEIAGRPPGGNSGEMMNYTCDCDIYNAWAEAMISGRISQQITRKYNVAMIFKRAHGQGRIKAIEGLAQLQQQLGDSLLRADLLPIGARRRNWKQTLLSDGFVMLRHPDEAVTLKMADMVDKHLTIYAG